MTTLTCPVGLDRGATFGPGHDPDDPEELVTFASDEGHPFMVVVIHAGDWVRLGRPDTLATTMEAAS